MRLTILCKGSFIGSIASLLSGMEGLLVVGVYLFDGFVVVGVILMGIGGMILVDLFERLLHFYFGTGQHVR